MDVLVAMLVFTSFTFYDKYTIVTEDWILIVVYHNYSLHHHRGKMLIAIYCIYYPKSMKALYYTKRKLNSHNYSFLGCSALRYKDFPTLLRTEVLLLSLGSFSSSRA